MGAIVCAHQQATQRRRPASDRGALRGAEANCEARRVRGHDRPDSAPAVLVLSVARPVDDAQAGHNRAGRPAGVISSEQELLLELKRGEELVEQVLHEGRDLLSALPSPHTRDVLQALEDSEAPIACIIRGVRDRHAAACAGADVVARSRQQSAASSVNSESSEVERMCARQTKRGVKWQERQERPWTQQSVASNPDEKQMEGTFVLQQVLDMESGEEHRLTADVLALLSKRRANDGAYRDAVIKIQRFMAKREKGEYARQEAKQALRQAEEAAEKTLSEAEEAAEQALREAEELSINATLTAAELAKVLREAEEAEEKALTEAEEAAEQAQREAEELSINATLTAAELDEAEQILGDVVEGDARELVEQAACDQRLDDILREGELLLQLLPDSDARSLLQIVDYTPRVDADAGVHPHSSNNNSVVSALRAKVYASAEDALVQAEALLADQSSDGAKDMENAGENVDEFLSEGESLLSLLPFSDADVLAAEINCAASPIPTAMASPDVIRRNSGLSYLRSPGKAEADLEERKKAEARKNPVLHRPATAHCNAIMEAGGEEMVDILRESERLLGSLPSPHARCLIEELETAHNPIAGALRTFHNRQDIASLAISYFELADSQGRRNRASGHLVVRDATDGPVVEEDGFGGAHAGRTGEVDAVLADPVYSRDANGHLVLRLRTSTQTEMNIIKSVGMADCDVQVVEEWRRQTIDSCVETEATVVKEKMVQDVVEVEDATTLMPPFPTDQELMVDWHMLTNEEIEEARESHLNHIVKETIERLVYSCENEAWAEACKVFESAKDERKLFSAKTNREDAVFVRARVAQEAEEAERLSLNELARQREREREALKAQIARKREEAILLRSYLDMLPVVKVIETVDQKTGKRVEDPAYEYARIPYEDETAVRLQEEAERAYQSMLQAEMKAEAARLAVAEEVFELEAARAKVRLEAFRLQQKLEAAQRKTKQENDTMSELDARRGAEQELKEGWVNVRRPGHGAGLQRRVYVLRRTAILTFADEARSGGCLNAIGLEHIESVSKGSGDALEIHRLEGDAITLHCGGLQGRDSWVAAFNGALKRFRSTYVAQPVLPTPPRKKDVQKDEWDSAVEEKLRQEVEARTSGVRAAKLEQDRADKALRAAQLEHQRLNDELKLRDPMLSLSVQDMADQNRGEWGGGAVSRWKLIEDACSPEVKKMEQDSKRALEQAERNWELTFRNTERRVHELDQQIAEFKKLSPEERRFANLENPYKNAGRQAVFAPKGGTLGGTGTSDDTVNETERLSHTTAGSTVSISRPGTYVCDDNYHLFSDGGQAVLLKGTSTSVFCTDEVAQQV